jgi:hypothetical protein
MNITCTSVLRLTLEEMFIFFVAIVVESWGIGALWLVGRAFLVSVFEGLYQVLENQFRRQT